MTQRGWTPHAYLTIAQVVVALHGCSGTFDTPRGPTSLEGGDGDVETSEQAADGVSDTDEPPQSGDGDTNANDDALDAGDSSPGSAGETLEAGAGAGPVGAGDLPCDVASLLATYCVACHQQPPVAGAHVALLSASDLRASSPTRPGLTLGDEALARMQASDATRMPPGGARRPRSTRLRPGSAQESRRGRAVPWPTRVWPSPTRPSVVMWCARAAASGRAETRSPR